MHVVCIVSTFGKSFDNTASIVRDNCSINHCITIKLQIRLIGTSIHRLQLGVQEMMSEDEETIADVHTLIV